MDRIETDSNGLHGVFFKFMENRLDIKVVFAQNHLVCDLTIILLVKAFHITIF